MAANRVYTQFNVYLALIVSSKLTDNKSDRV
jgi:hypothetical protein